MAWRVLWDECHRADRYLALTVDNCVTNARHIHGIATIGDFRTNKNGILYVVDRYIRAYVERLRVKPNNNDRRTLDALKTEMPATVKTRANAIQAQSQSSHKLVNAFTVFFFFFTITLISILRIGIIFYFYLPYNSSALFVIRQSETNT